MIIYYHCQSNDLRKNVIEDRCILATAAFKIYCGENFSFADRDWEEACVSVFSDINLNGQSCCIGKKQLKLLIEIVKPRNLSMMLLNPLRTNFIKWSKHSNNSSANCRRIV